MTGEKIKKAREKAGLTREDVASKIGVSSMTVFRWENKNTTPHRVFQKKLEQILGIKGK